MHALLESGIKSAVINLHYLPNKIREAARSFSPSTSLEIDFSPESKILGTSGALCHAEKLLKGREIVILNGKIYSEIDLSLALDAHRANDALVTLVVLPFPPKANFNPVRVSKDGAVLGFGPSNLGTPTLFTGIQIWNREVLLNLPEGPSDSVKDVYPSLIEKGQRIYSHLSRDYWCECSTPDRYWRSSMEVLRRHLKRTSHVSCMDPSRENVIRGTKVEIEIGSQVEDTIIWEDVIIQKDCLIRNAILCTGVRLPRNTRLENVIVTPLFNWTSANRTHRPQVENDFLIWPLDC
jgi:mannose-1-phosphate guanylyltransferase